MAYPHSITTSHPPISPPANGGEGRADIRLTRLLKDLLTDDRRLKDVWDEFCRISEGMSGIPYHTGKAWLQDSRHGSFPLNKLPDFITAMRNVGIETGPVVQLITAAISKAPKINGSILDEFLGLHTPLGSLARAIDEGTIATMSRTQLRELLVAANRMTDLCRCITAELLHFYGN